MTDLETPDPGRALAERIMTGLRLSDGLDAASVMAVARRLAPGTAATLIDAVNALREAGLLRERGTARADRWILTRRGAMLADRIASELMAIVDP